MTKNSGTLQSIVSINNDSRKPRNPTHDNVLLMHPLIIGIIISIGHPLSRSEHPDSVLKCKEGPNSAWEDSWTKPPLIGDNVIDLNIFRISPSFRESPGNDNLKFCINQGTSGTSAWLQQWGKWCPVYSYLPFEHFRIGLSVWSYSPDDVKNIISKFDLAMTIHSLWHGVSVHTESSSG